MGDFTFTKTATEGEYAVEHAGAVIGHIRKGSRTSGQATTSGRVVTNMRTTTVWRIVGDPYFFPFATKAKAAADMLRRAK